MLYLGVLFLAKVLDNALSYKLFNANNEEIAADTARNTPGTYTVVPAAALKSGWDERYSLNRVNGTLTVEDKVEELFTVTVKTDGNGTASASHAKAVAGTEITLTATPNKGYHFKEWQVESPTGLVITNNKFLMPDSNVEVKAIFEEDVPALQYKDADKTTPAPAATATPAPAATATPQYTIPQTGDTSNPALLVVLMLVSGSAAIGTAVVASKKKHNR